MDENYDIHQNKRSGKTYVSRLIVKDAVKDDDENVILPERRIRIASKVIENSGTDSFAKIKNELVVRRTQGGKQEIRAVFHQDDRGLETLTFQRYGVDTNNPYKSAHFSFRPHEIEKIIEFLSTLKLLKFKNDDKINLTDQEISELLIDNNRLMSILHADVSTVVEFAKNEITSEDIVALAYRKRQLSIFENLLKPEYMAKKIATRNAAGEEKVWQDFFEQNPWIFGYGLNFTFSSVLDNKKLELTVKGSDLDAGGKRIDALLKSIGAVNSLCYVEIKKASTPLLNNEYRKECWSIGSEVSGGVSQVQNTIEIAVENFGRQFMPTNEQGAPTGETLFNYKPKGYLIVGNLNQFIEEHGINRPKFRSFELYRRNLHLPEIITFDELFHRATGIVASQE